MMPVVERVDGITIASQKHCFGWKKLKKLYIFFFKQDAAWLNPDTILEAFKIVGQNYVNFTLRMFCNIAWEKTYLISNKFNPILAEKKYES